MLQLNGIATKSEPPENSIQIGINPIKTSRKSDFTGIGCNGGCVIVGDLLALET